MSEVEESSIKMVAAGRGTTMGKPKIIEKVIELTEKEHPKILYLGTPSRDKEVNWEQTGLPYEKAGYEVIQFNLWDDETSGQSRRKKKQLREISKLIEEVDVILVSGGSCKTGVQKWEELGIDELLVEAVVRDDGPVIAGGSAGAMVWFERNGLGVIPALVVPHHDKLDQNNVPHPDNLLAQYPEMTCVGIEEEAALVINGQEATVVSSDGEATCSFKQRTNPETDDQLIETVELQEDVIVQLSDLGIQMETAL